MRRNLPSVRQLKTRSAILESYKDLTPVFGDFYGFEKGNKKTGVKNSRGEEVLIWNLPPVVTCPGALDCLKYCYNADTRIDIFPIESWCINWYWVLYKKAECVNKIDQILSTYPHPVIRVHSSGDFFSQDYIEMWKQIANHNPNALFWAYTRSWRVNELENGIRELSKLSNFQIIASVDYTENLPIDMRYCIVGESESGKGMFNCPEQYLSGIQCVDCRQCYTYQNTNIYFAKH